MGWGEVRMEYGEIEARCDDSRKQVMQWLSEKRRV